MSATVGNDLETVCNNGAHFNTRATECNSLQPECSQKHSRKRVVEHKGFARRAGFVFALEHFNFTHMRCPAKSGACPAIAGHLTGGAKWLVKQQGIGKPTGANKTKTQEETS